MRGEPVAVAGVFISHAWNDKPSVERLSRRPREAFLKRHKEPPRALSIIDLSC